MTQGNSTLVSRNITVLGHRTSVRLEPDMWEAIKDIAERESCKIHDICSLISLRKNARTSLTAAIRVFIMLYYKSAATEDGHRQAGHGSFDDMMRRARTDLAAIRNEAIHAVHNVTSTKAQRRSNDDCELKDNALKAPPRPKDTNPPCAAAL